MMVMFLRAKIRKKDGKEHRYFSIVESKRVHGGKVGQKHVLYLGEINDSQKVAWCKTIDVVCKREGKKETVAIFPDDRQAPPMDCPVVQVRLNELRLRHPRQWGACWLSTQIWDQLQLDGFWTERLKPSRKGTEWLQVLKVLTFYRWIDPGSEWRLHREWYGRTALPDLLGIEAAIADDTLYRCLDKLVEHKKALFSFLKDRWQNLFGVKYEVLLYDLTSTYFECDVPTGDSKKKFGYSRDKRPDCVQVVIALIVTPEGFPLAYEVMDGNTSDKTTLKDFLEKIDEQYGKAERVWVMDRGIPTEAVLSQMRSSAIPVSYLVGTPRGRLNALEKQFLEQPWEKAKDSVSVKLVEQDQEVYILARSSGRVDKERSMRKRKLKKLWKRLHDLREQTLTRDQLLMKVAVAKNEAGQSSRLLSIKLPDANEAVSAETFGFHLDKAKLRVARRREGSYLLRSNLTGNDPAHLWQYYIQLTEIEQVFKELKHDLSLRPIYHQKEDRIDAHIFVSFLAYCLQITLKQRLRALAPGLTPRSVLEKFSAIQMVDVHLPTTDGREFVLSRYTEPEKDIQILLQQLALTLPAQPPPKVYPKQLPAA